MSIIMFQNGAVVNTTPCAEGKPPLLFEGGVWTANAEGNPNVSWLDIKDAYVLSDEDVAILNATGELPQKFKDLIGYL